MSTTPSRRPATGGAAAIGIAIAGAALIAVLNGLLAISPGLVVVTFLATYYAAHALAATAPGARGSRLGVSLALGLAMILAGALGSWALSLPQGGVLGPVDYILQTMGPLVAVLVGASAAGAWLGSR